MIEFSVIVPCYNEAENIRPLLEAFSKFLPAENAELILIDNGSADETDKLKAPSLRDYPFLKWIHIDKNIGYGNGIMTGLKHAKGKYIGYTHGDLQTDPNDLLLAFEVIKKMPPNNKIFIKGTRSGRNLVSRVFSTGFELLASLILNCKLKEINAQPVVFNAQLLECCVNPPLHWGIDLFLYYTAHKNSYAIKRIPVIFPERRHGVSKWHTGFFSRVKFSLNMLKYCFELKKHNKQINVTHQEK